MKFNYFNHGFSANNFWIFAAETMQEISIIQHSQKFQIFIKQNLLEHRTQIHLSRIIRQILLNVFSVALIQCLLHNLSTGVGPPAVMCGLHLHHVPSTSSTSNMRGLHLHHVPSTSSTSNMCGLKINMRQNLLNVSLTYWATL